MHIVGNHARRLEEQMGDMRRLREDAQRDVRESGGRRLERRGILGQQGLAWIESTGGREGRFQGVVQQVQERLPSGQARLARGVGGVGGVGDEGNV